MDIPVELKAVFRRYPDAKLKFDGYSPSHQREYVGYVAEAKKSQTRKDRADRVVMMLTGRKLKSVYQPKTIPEVFGLKPGMRTKVVNQPNNYSEIMSGWRPDSQSHSQIDLGHLFVDSMAQLNKELPKLLRNLKPNGMIWVSWPKKTSGIRNDVSENTIRDLALQLGLVDVKVCAVSDIWSGLKLIIPLKNRSK